MATQVTLPPSHLSRLTDGLATDERSQAVETASVLLVAVPSRSFVTCRLVPRTPALPLLPSGPASHEHAQVGDGRVNPARSGLSLLYPREFTQHRPHLD